MRTILLLAALLTEPLWALEAFQKSFVEADGGLKIWVEYRPAHTGSPTLFFLNGLTWDTQDWPAFIEELDADYGVVLMDLEGQGKTFAQGPAVREDIPFDRQARNLDAVQRALAISGRKIAVGFSYGGGVVLNYLRLFPGVFDKAIVMAPYLHPLPQHDRQLKNMVRGHRFMVPLDMRSDEEIYRDYLRQTIHASLIATQPELMAQPSKRDAIFHMTAGALKWQALDHVNEFPKDTIHLIGAVEDELVQDADLQNFWAHLPSGASYLRLESGGHYIPKEHPAFVAGWIQSILKKDSKIGGRKSYKIRKAFLESADCMAHVATHGLASEPTIPK